MIIKREIYRQAYCSDDPPEGEGWKPFGVSSSEWSPDALYWYREIKDFRNGTISPENWSKALAGQSGKEGIDV